MNFINKDVAFSRGLPKWPQLIVTGKPITVDQAKDIISKTDTFLTGLSPYSGGNDRQWLKWACEVLGYDKLFELENHMFRMNAHENSSSYNHTVTYFDLIKDLSEKLGYISTNYVHNSWASSSYVYGPHGWVSPRGQICHVDNVGKWPSVEEVYNDFITIATAFPYLNLTATLHDGESCEDSRPVVTMLISGAEVNGSRSGVAEVNFTDDHDKYHHEVTEIPDRSEEAMMRMINPLSRNNYRYERDVPQEWIIEWGEKIKPIVIESIDAFKLINRIDLK